MLLLTVLSTALPAARAQLSLEDVVVRGVEVTADLRPESFQGSVDRNGSLRGKAVLDLEVTSPNPVPELRVYLDDDLTLKQVTGAPVTFRRERQQIVLSFSPALAPGSRHSLMFEYEGKPFLVWDELILVDDGVLYPVIVSPFGDLAANRARLRVTVTIPAGYQLASTGQVTRSEAGGVQTYQWDTVDPLPYLAVTGGKVYRITERKVGAIDLAMFVRPGYDRFLGQIAEFTQKAADYYSMLLYAFPYTRITVVSAPFGRGLLGLGYPGLMMITESAFTGAAGDLNRDSYRLLLIAHEAAHTYFPAQTSGKGVASIWLSEGFAEYLGLMTVESVMGRDALARELADERKSYAAVVGRDRPIAFYTRINTGTPDGIAVRYAKGSLVLHMLRGVVGTEAFTRILSTYATRYRGQSVRVDDFIRVASEISGQDLGWFFREWISERVLPDYTVSGVGSGSGPEGIRTEARVRNLGTGTMPVDVVFEMEGGEKVTQRVEIGNQAEVAVSITTPRGVRRVEVDPDKWILQANYTNDAFTVR